MALHARGLPHRFRFRGAVIALALTAVKGVQTQETGIASALFNASQQIGVALGLAVLSTIAVSATAGRLPGALAALYRGRETGDAGLVRSASDALIHGYGLALAGAGAALVIAAVIAAVLVNAKRDRFLPARSLSIDRIVIKPTARFRGALPAVGLAQTPAWTNCKRSG